MKRYAQFKIDMELKDRIQRLCPKGTTYSSFLSMVLDKYETAKSVKESPTRKRTKA